MFETFLPLFLEVTGLANSSFCPKMLEDFGCDEPNGFFEGLLRPNILRLCHEIVSIHTNLKINLVLIFENSWMLWISKYILFAVDSGSRLFSQDRH